MHARLICWSQRTALLLAAVASAGAQSPLPNSPVASGLAAWPQSGQVRRGDHLEVTTFDMPSVPVPCWVKAVTADQLICSRTRNQQMYAFDRASVQSLVLDRGERRRPGSVIFPVSGLLMLSGLMCAVAGAGVPGSVLMLAGLGGFLFGAMANTVEAFRGPMRPQTVYIAAGPPLPPHP